MVFLSFKELTETVIQCHKCPRLVYHREHVSEGWQKPVPGFGDINASLLILGLAPSPQGGNRTGRIFTGDKSGDFFIKTLYQTGFASQESSRSKDDGLKLSNCYITAAVKCVPPMHKPNPEEFRHCFPYLESEFFLLKNLKAVLTLGKSAFDTYRRFLKLQNLVTHPKFAHGAIYKYEGWPTHYASFHPSPQNVNTGKLTQAMLVTLLERIKKEL